MFGSLVAMLDQSLIMHVGRGQVRSQASSGSAGWWSVEVKTRRSPKRICIALRLCLAPESWILGLLQYVCFYLANSVQTWINQVQNVRLVISHQTVQLVFFRLHLILHARTTNIRCDRYCSTFWDIGVELKGLTERTCQSSTFASVDTGSLKALAVSSLVFVVMAACTRTVRTLSHE